MSKPNISLRRIFRINCGVCGHRIKGAGAYCDACNIFLHGVVCADTHLGNHITYFNTERPEDQQKLEEIIKQSKNLMRGAK